MRTIGVGEHLGSFIIAFVKNVRNEINPLLDIEDDLHEIIWRLITIEGV
ncbi:hypothetical protein DsansV1_C03g0028811 [Dioscorea sansibarensis]